MFGLWLTKKTGAMIANLTSVVLLVVETVNVRR